MKTEDTMGGRIAVCVAAVSVVAAVACAVAAVGYHRALRRCETQLAAIENTARNKSRGVGETDGKVGKTDKKQDEVDEKREMKVLGVRYDGDVTLDVTLSERPDMDVVKNYVRVAPLNEGIASFRYEMRWDSGAELDRPHLIVTGDFAFRTNAALVIRRGFPLYRETTVTANAGANAGAGRSATGGAKTAGALADGALAADYVYTFRRNDREANVKFVAKGRYLPPDGRRAVAVEAVNADKIHAAIRRVPPQNVVQMLAREEGVYSETSWRSWTTPRRLGDEDWNDTAELAEEPSAYDIPCANRPNVSERAVVTLAADGGRAANGIYFVTVSVKEGACTTFRNRVVCQTDLGLSVRQSGGETGVWVTSFLTGRPVAGCRIAAYSSANIKVGEGVTDANGWCVVSRVAKGEPFVVTAETASGDDRSFLALRDTMAVDETYADGARADYLAPDDADAFLWTERGIYRHNEPIFLHALLRNGARRAPRPFPVEVTLTGPEGRVLARRTLIPDDTGALSCDAFRVPDDQPSGVWTVAVKTPGTPGRTLASRRVSIEEFAPPQIRVTVAPAPRAAPQAFAFTVRAEHLFGGPAKALPCEGAVVFEDAPFTPDGWAGYRFGNDDDGLRPCHLPLDRRTLDAQGRAAFTASLPPDAGRPKAAVRVIAQGVAFEDGGRPAVARATAVCHYWPYYIGVALKDWMPRPDDGRLRLPVACVAPDGARVASARTLTAKIDRIDAVYTCRKNDNGWYSWDCERLRVPVADGLPLETVPDKDAVLTLPALASGEYALTVVDGATGASFARTFYLGDDGDADVRAPLGDPAAVALQPDKAFYRPGETPRLLVKAPFAGAALLSVLRDKTVYTEVIDLTNATSVVCLRPVAAAWAPNVDVTLSVVQGVKAGDGRLAVRAHGQTTVCVRPAEDECPVQVAADVAFGADGEATVTVDVDARGAAAVGTRAVVTVVDEGINLLTDEPTPDPVGALARPRTARHSLFDLYGRLLPVLGDDLRKGGVKTGGDGDDGLLLRVSPEPTRRFKPLALWREDVPLTGGCARVAFRLPEFVGDVRVTAVAWSAGATGAASVRRTVAPRLVMQPDAPRFAAPGDTFEVSLPLANRSGADGAVQWEVSAVGALENTVRNGSVALADGGREVVTLNLRAGRAPGQGEVVFTARGYGETHVRTLHLPIRPAVAWRTHAATVRLAPGETRTFRVDGAAARLHVAVSGSPVAELAAALEWLADYPHGCLEQTASRIFPLMTAGAVLEAAGSRAVTNLEDYVAAGVRRVESMARETDFVMWPDCAYAPWDREVSLYAAHFLAEAGRTGRRLNPAVQERTRAFLKKWALSTNDTVAAYACHTLALAGAPDDDRMFRLYDKAASLDALARARLARAFALTRDTRRAAALLADAPAPGSVKAAAFTVLALLDLDADDARLPALVQDLLKRRDRVKAAWGTTADNAHALLALGAYYRRHPPQTGAPRVRVTAADLDAPCDLGDGARRASGAAAVTVENTARTEAFVAWRAQDLPPAGSVTNEAAGLRIERAYFTADGRPADLAALSRGDLLVTELTIGTDRRRDLSDLVIEDLFPGAFEPVRGELDPSLRGGADETWVMRKDARDDRMLVFSKKFTLEAHDEAKVRYPVRVVSAGDFSLPGPSVDAMYAPALRARRAPGRVVVAR